MQKSSNHHSIANNQRSRMQVFTDEVTLQSIKPGSRILYERAQNRFKEFNSEDFAATKPSEQQVMTYFTFLCESGAKSKTPWTTYSMLNSINKAKFRAKLQDMPQFKNSRSSMHCLTTPGTSTSTTLNHTDQTALSDGIGQL